MMASTCDDAEKLGARRMCAMAVGRGLFLAWLLTSLIPSSTLPAGADDDATLLALRLPPLLWRRLDEARVRRVALAAAAALGTAGCVLYALVAFGAVSRAVQFAAIACTVAAVPLAGPLWGELFYRLGAWEATCATLAGLAVAAADLLAVTLLPAVPAAVVLAGTPAASCALLALARRGLAPRSEAACSPRHVCLRASSSRWPHRAWPWETPSSRMRLTSCHSSCPRWRPCPSCCLPCAMTTAPTWRMRVRRSSGSWPSRCARLPSRPCRGRLCNSRSCVTSAWACWRGSPCSALPGRRR